MVALGVEAAKSLVDRWYVVAACEELQRARLVLRKKERRCALLLTLPALGARGELPLCAGVRFRRCGMCAVAEPTQPPSHERACDGASERVSGCPGERANRQMQDGMEGEEGRSRAIRRRPRCRSVGVAAPSSPLGSQSVGRPFHWSRLPSGNARARQVRRESGGAIRSGAFSRKLLEMAAMTSARPRNTLEEVLLFACSLARSSCSWSLERRPRQNEVACVWAGGWVYEQVKRVENAFNRQRLYKCKVQILINARRVDPPNNII